jgi:prepilin signal peptidase PulO-like enzyme (type II secretory pathway)
MDQTLIVTILAVLGLCMGSFAGATVWRLRARQLVVDKAEGESVDKTEYKKLSPLAKASPAKDRSRCLHCGHTLAWYDLLPLASWVSTGGKCRYCQEPIGWFEPVIEVGTATLFVASYLLWPYLLLSGADIALFTLWIVACVLLVILFTYDLKWYILPDTIVFPLIAAGGSIALIRLFEADDPLAALLTMFAAVAILSGLYFSLWAVSKGQWIGFGDVKLGLGLALLLGNWESAFLALFAANFIGMVIVLPGLLSGKLSRKAHVPFGPLLITGTVIAFFFGQGIIDWYVSSVAWIV